MQYQGVEKIQKNGSVAVVTIKVFDSELDKHFLVELAMQQLEMCIRDRYRTG